jgi:ATP-dependent helicase/nuclease subunit A
MNAPRIIPEAVRRVQIEASDPAVSAWVTANAGAGKTHVLAQRVIRLLLEGVAPAKILCITFTKAAAANMANRVFKTLREWTAFDDAALDAAIREVADLAPDPARRARARRLFAVALETPGGLKVQTIHAFCTRVLHQFPFEANVAARFDVLDETAESQLLNDISLGVFLDAAREPDGPLGRALAVATAEVADRTFKDVVGEAIRKRDVVRKWLEHGGSLAAVVAGLCGTLGITVDDTIEQVEREMVEGPLLPTSEWAAAAATLGQGLKSDREQAGRLLAALAGTASERADNYIRFFLTTTSEPRQRLITKAIETADPGLAQRIDAERPRMLALIERRKAIACRDRTAALLAIADAVISRYQAAKDRRGLLDYDDLIDKALTLLGEGRAAWVHYKLDQGIDHVLIDEAQDTSPKQWRIIRQLTSEFFAGAGARLVDRTIFAVGDEKQSIFSFQGAAPREFDGMRRAFATLCRAIGQDLQYVQFRHSFRSGPNVLGAVDTVFERPQAFSGLSADNVKTVHEALPDATPGLVEIWETLKPDAKREIEAWDAPFDESSEKSTQVRLAAKIAKNVGRWTKQGAGAGDVLVLVRQRGPLFEAIIRALKNLHIPVAGADRLVLTEHIAVMDLMVLADALLLPDDDLALATVLKSPLIGLDDDDLFEIAWQRKGSLRAALRAKAEADKHFADAAATLDRFAAWTRQPPFAFYARVLGAERGRQRFLARLGPEVDDALDEFLNLALDYERRETPSLQGFVAWLRAAQTNVKRDMEITRQEVRVMTVHGAKGLEAPIVVLADTTTEPAGPVLRQPKLLTLADDGAPPGSPDRFVWGRAKATDVAVVAAARERARREAEDEHRRLLYVAMTRAIDRLVVCGAEGARRPHQDCWWNLVSNALRPVSIEEPADDGEGTVWRYRKTPFPADKQITAGEPDATASADATPDWLRHDAPPDPAPTQPLSPSSAYDEEVPARARGEGNQAEREKAKTRGVLLHRLLQALPDIPREARIKAAQRHLARNGTAFSPEEREAMVEEIGRVLDDPRFSDLFLPGSRAEVPIVGRYDGRPVSGVVDRLAVTADSVLIADYKTNRIAREDGRERPYGSPRLSADVPEAYVAQLALYRAVLAQLYPDKTIRAALIWTYVPDLMELSGGALDAALARVTSP